EKGDGYYIFSLTEDVLSCYVPAGTAFATYRVVSDGETFVTIDVYGEYTGTGEYVAVCSGEGDGIGTVYYSTLITLDTEKKTLTMNGYTFEFNDKNEIEGPKDEKVIEFGTYTFDANAQAVTDLKTVVLNEDGTALLDGKVETTYDILAAKVVCVYFEMSGYAVFLLDPEAKTASFYVPADKELIGTYTGAEFIQFIHTVKVYGEYTGAGNYIIVAYATSGDLEKYCATYGKYDKENKTVTVLGITYTFDEKGNLTGRL
ncbi:MAG: hypothetical protein ACI4SH_00070, partial [Candidatus Scatosoma sp.]